MDSLLANYATSDEEEEEKVVKQQPLSSSTRSEPSSKPNPFFSSLPPPKSSTPKLSTSISSLLPPPKSKSKPSANPNPKKVFFTLPINPSDLNDSDDEEENKRKKPIKDNSSSSSLLKKSFSSMLPAPKNSLCLAPRKTNHIKLQDQQTPAPTPTPDPVDHSYSSGNSSHDASATSSWLPHQDSGTGLATDYGAYAAEGVGYGEGNYWNTADAAPQQELERFAGKKRGRSQMPTEIVEVNQEELMKNRPRPDQAKLTGIAFGPAYQAVASTKGKPSKLHKRKHQIGSLFFDMKQKETELAERRSKGFLTKAETQAKYGW